VQKFWTNFKICALFIVVFNEIFLSTINIFTLKIHDLKEYLKTFVNRTAAIVKMILVKNCVSQNFIKKIKKTQKIKKTWIAPRSMFTSEKTKDFDRIVEENEEKQEDIEKLMLFILRIMNKILTNY